MIRIAIFLLGFVMGVAIWGQVSTDKSLRAIENMHNRILQLNAELESCKYELSEASKAAVCESREAAESSPLDTKALAAELLQQFLDTPIPDDRPPQKCWTEINVNEGWQSIACDAPHAITGDNE